jgi:SAM-dependent methyltransferase
MCKAIEHSSSEQKAKYLDGMAKSCAHKLETIKPWLVPGGWSVDLGCADGRFTRALAKNYAGRMVGIDSSAEIVGLAKIRLAEDIFSAGVDFQVGRAEDFTMPNISNVVASSIIHEVYSYGDKMESVRQALANIHKNLKSGGRLIIRDFVRPEDRKVNFLHDKKDIVKGHSYGDFHGVSPEPNSGSFEVYSNQNLSNVYEYIYRKDFHDNWQTELQETYGFWSLGEAKALIEEAGFKLIHVAELENQWILENRLEGKIMIDNPDGNPLAFPKYNTNA